MDLSELVNALNFAHRLFEDPLIRTLLVTGAITLVNGMQAYLSERRTIMRGEESLGYYKMSHFVWSTGSGAVQAAANYYLDSVSCWSTGFTVGASVSARLLGEFIAAKYTELPSP